MDFVEAFRNEGQKIERDVAEECERICKDALISRNDFMIRWEAYAMSRGRALSSPSLVDLRAMAKDLAADHQCKQGMDEDSTRLHRASTSLPRSRPRSVYPNDPASALVRRVGPPVPLLATDDFFAYFENAEELEAELKAPDGAEQSRGDLSTGADPDAFIYKDRSAENSDKNPSRINAIVGGSSLDITAAVALPGDDNVSSSEAYANRPDVGTVLSTLNGSVKKLKPTPGGIKVTSTENVAAQNDFTYMNDDLVGLTETVRERIRCIGEAILARRAANLTGRVSDDTVPMKPSPEAFYSATPNVVLALGRIRVELDGGGLDNSSAPTTRINAASVQLEGEDGHIIKLSLNRVIANGKPLFLNPGMVVVVEGVNTNGRIFDVHTLHDNAMPVADEIRANDQTTLGDVEPVAARVMVTAGPYTLPSNLKYEPLYDLLELIPRSRPDLVILLGPFVDEEHSLVDECLPMTFDSLFESRVLRPITACAENCPNTTFALVPSINDIHHHPVCPQPPFPVPTSSASVPLHPRVAFVSNPCTLVLTSPDGRRAAVIGATTLPSVRDLSASALILSTRDRLAALAAHMLRQRSFYPSLPPSAAVPLDYARGLAGPRGLDIAPHGVDVLVAPSVLTPFARAVVDGAAPSGEAAVAVNPGLLVRGVGGGGTYAEIGLPLRRHAGALDHMVKAQGQGKAFSEIIVEIYRH